jgi:hypothetical protein
MRAILMACAGLCGLAMGGPVLAVCYGDPQMINTHDLQREFYLRGEAHIRTATYPGQWLPQCPVTFGFASSSASSDCKKDDAISSAVFQTVTGVPTLAVVFTNGGKSDSIAMTPFEREQDGTFKTARSGDETYYLEGQSTSKKYNFYVYLEHAPAPQPSPMMLKTFRLEVFDQSDENCLKNEPQNDLFWALENANPVAKEKTENHSGLLQQWKDDLDARVATLMRQNIIRINETQVGDGSEPRHQ